jgi:predicted transcriptional regulator of viral defense system
MFGVSRHKRSGGELRVSNFERTLVDVLDRPELSGSWEEIWRSLASIEFFDIEQVIDYVLLLGNATTAAKVGFFLEQHREDLMVDERHLKPLQALRPHQPHYLLRRRRKRGRWMKKWNLMVPDEILNQSWGEVL